MSMRAWVLFSLLLDQRYLGSPHGGTPQTHAQRQQTCKCTDKRILLLDPEKSTRIGPLLKPDCTAH